ncbi:SDR family oxidoreductase [Amycolatopsis sacchari]|uniref:Short chain dehydrogenase n=1 Tax=Amycolatopsis sacchari TaxID=115433 RepID=A0A1I4DC12_9PSEU|nr:short chain dehydrogenase [Amycolatopsis sacchari]
MGQLAGKTAVVTGGGTGIGLATALRLAAEGAHVFVTGRRKTELDAAVETIGAAGATAVAGDVTNPADLDRLYDAVRARGRGLDVVFANAAWASLATLEQVNAISPGPIDTPGITSLFGEDKAPDVKARLGAGVAMGRMGRPEEVAAFVRSSPPRRAVTSSAPTCTSTAGQTRSKAGSCCTRRSARRCAA